MTPARLRLGFVSPDDPLGFQSWSGAKRQMYYAFQAQGLHVDHIGSSIAESRTRACAALVRLLPRPARTRFNARKFRRSAPKYARAMEIELQSIPVDVLFAPAASEILAQINTALPVIYLSDTTARLSLGYYNRRPYPRRVQEYYESCESRALARADVVLYFNKWAAESAVRDYGVDPSKVHIFGTGGNVTVPANLDSILAAKQYNQCRLLFIGSDWERKGGDVAVDILDALVEAGIDATLTVCSRAVPAGVRQHRRVRFEGFLRKDNAAEAKRYNELLCEAHFILVPSRADCGSFAALEANAHGVPAVARETGGLAEVVADGRNGLLLPNSAQAVHFARAIVDTWGDRSKYVSLVASTREFYQSLPQWAEWAERVTALAAELVCRRRRPTV